MKIWALLVDSRFQAIQGSPDEVEVEPSLTIMQIKTKVIKECGINLPNAAAGNLSVWKTRDDSNLNISLTNFEEIPENLDEVRNAIRRIAENTLVGDLGLLDEEILLVRYLKTRVETHLGDDGGQEILTNELHGVSVLEKNIFIKVDDWGIAFVDSDLYARNEVEPNSVLNKPVPDFVKNLEGQLDRKRSLNSDRYDAYKRLFQFQSLDSYFERTDEPEEFTSESEGHRHDVWETELSHLSHITTYPWERRWKGRLKEPSMHSIFFVQFVLDNHISTIDVKTGYDRWPFHLIVECVGPSKKGQLRKFQPRSDFMLLKSTLPRLLIEVNSKPERHDNMPEDLIRMLLCGAAVVRFANSFLNRFKDKKDFVLIAMYVKGDGVVTRFSLYQMPDESGVYYREINYELTTSNGRAEFVRQLYNLRHVLENEETGYTEADVAKFRRTIMKHRMKSFTEKSFTTKNTKDSNSKGSNPNKRMRLDPSGGAGNEGAELKARGYDVEPGDYDYDDYDYDDGKGRVTKRLSHIFVVILQSDRSKRFVAKKIREGSNELDIFEKLSSLPKSEHIISLRESIRTQSALWAITPQMSSVAECVWLLSDKLNGKVVEFCNGLINGVAHLHKFCIAHRDIKPENLVFDKNFTLKIIDFDSAKRVDGPDDVVDGICGTEGWMAPELVRKSMYSPIRVDRWSTGKVISHLLEKSGKEDKGLMVIVSKLTTDDPKKRLDMVNTFTSRKAPRYLKDPPHSEAKKPKLICPSCPRRW